MLVIVGGASIVMLSVVDPLAVVIVIGVTPAGSAGTVITASLPSLLVTVAAVPLIVNVAPVRLVPKTLTVPPVVGR